MTKSGDETMEREKKLLKKLKRKQALFLKQEPDLGIHFLDTPSLYVYIGNGGTQNGISREILLEILGRDRVGELYTPTGEDYAFVHFTTMKDASSAVELLNGVCLQEICKTRNLLHLASPTIVNGPPLHLYLCYVNKMPPTLSMQKEICMELPSGLILIPDYISPADETKFIEFFTQTSGEQVSTKLNEYTLDCMAERHLDPMGKHECQTEACGTATCTGKQLLPRKEVTLEPPITELPYFHPPESTLKHRKVKHYGYEFLYSSSNIDPNNPLPGGLPEICLPVLRRLVNANLISELPDQLTINEYLPGAGIPPHIDTHSAFEDGIISISLGSQVVMDFKHPHEARKVSVFLSRRSLLIMKGESRYLWTHGIPARKFDTVHPQMPGYKPADGASGPTVIARGTRISLTFRKIRTTPCKCSYPLQCDSQTQ